MREVEALLGASHVDAEEEFEITHVLDSELSVEVVDDVLDECHRGTGDDDVVHIQKKVDDVAATAEREQQ